MTAFAYPGYAMAEGAAMGSLSSALSSQTLSIAQTQAQPSQQPPPTQGALLAPQPTAATSGPPPGGAVIAGVVAPDPSTSPETPAKRRPGRPKGSGKKSIDLGNQPMKPKRPVGRPRKDGLPPGSVTEKKQRPRKRPPGSFASIPNGGGGGSANASGGGGGGAQAAAGVMPYAVRVRFPPANAPQTSEY